MIDLLPTPWHWANAIAIAVVVGAAKTGIPGLGFLAVPWLAWVLAPQALLSVGALLPLLIVADIIAVWMWRKNRAVHHLWSLLPWVLIGMAAGTGLLIALPERSFNAIIGGTVMAMIAVHLWRTWRGGDPPGRAVGAGVGIIAGTTTTLANAAGPVMNLYLLAQRLPKEEFIAAGAWFFFVVNLMKAPIYALLAKPMITSQTLLLDACLVPAVVLGSLLGRRLVPHIPQRAFEALMVVLAAAAALRLLLT